MVRISGKLSSWPILVAGVHDLMESSHGVVAQKHGCDRREKMDSRVSSDDEAASRRTFLLLCCALVPSISLEAEHRQFQNG